MTVTVEEATQQARSNAWQVVGRRRPKWMKNCSFRCALSRSKIYFLGTLAVIIAAACITIPLVLNQKSHSSNPNNATRELATTIAEALATATSPTSAQAAVTAASDDLPKTNPAEESVDADKEDSAGDQADSANHNVSPMNAEVPKQPEQPTHAMPEATQPAHTTHEVPQPTNPAPTHELPGTTHDEPQHGSSPMFQQNPMQPEHPSSMQPEHPNPTQPEHPSPTQPDQLHETQPTAMETQYPEVRQPEHDNMNGAVSPQVPPAAESPAPLTQGFPTPEHLPMTTGPV